MNNGILPLLGCVTRLHAMIYGPDAVFPSSRVKTLNHYLHTRHVSFCVMPIVCTHYIYFHLLTLLPIETCVFPRLLSLSFRQHTNFECILLFLSPTLRRCALQLHPLLKYLGTRCPDLENLDVVSPLAHGQTADDLALLSDTVRSCKRLVKLRCSPLDSASWTHFSNLHTLLSRNLWGVSPIRPR
ncbi:hypothetical protein K503DRAFT_60425 [Rhizopogon vinicolor AM-OR11-026]|uniref:F-box domain-containing protein n=1 Tax=Rhizopogon vinicolor AM-OR11-026 TaxID=1314800 RepID=A0A1B7MGE2_9AGAM|nr:hypothetical protein K503DRAFT_60425 [Rhizopogon vinicolor AM-OR11-026]